ncbi:MAG TPA: aldo/keto reductase [Dehalococcoidia bacterium]|nr:aldo/keto reductase [Dehalococcoidia bacterium]
MEYHRLGKSELNVSVIGLGTWAIGGFFWGPTDEKEAIAAIQKAIDSGINLIDTAPIYGDGHSEETIGKAIKGHRQQVVIATKCGARLKDGKPLNDLTPKSIRKELEVSLKLLDTDVIDLYQCHFPDPNTPIEETMAEMSKMKAEGKIRCIGVSNFDVTLLQKAKKVAPIVSNQVQYSMLNRDIEKELVPFCQEQDIGILAYGPMGGGILTGKYKEMPKFEAGDARSFFYNYYQEPQWSQVQTLLKALESIAARHGKPVSQVAVNWARQQPGITSALVGARSHKQAEANAAAGNWQLSADEMASIKEALKQALG